MAYLHAAAILASLIDVKCPHCKRSQKKPRFPVPQFRVCKFCHKRFPAEARRR